MTFPNTINGSEQEAYNTYTDKRHALGQKLVTEDGRAFRFVLAGEALVAAQLVQAVVPSADFIDLDVVAIGAVGDNTADITQATTFSAKDSLEDGYVVFYETGTPGTLGHGYRIESNTLTSSGSTTLTVTFGSGVGLTRAITTSTDADLCISPYSGALIGVASAVTGRPLGIAITNIANASYGWVQTRGLAGVQVDDAGAFDPGDSLSAGPDKGSLTLAAADDLEIVGVCVTPSSADDFGIAYLKLEG